MPSLRSAAIYSSDLPRALETATILAKVLRPDESSPVPVDRALREIDFGDWAGRSYAELIADLAEIAAAERFFADLTDVAPPNGETANVVATRVTSAMQAIAVAHPDSAAIVVGHAGALRLALARALGMPLASYWRLRLDCASLSIVDLTDTGIIVERLNDVSQLKWS